MSRVTQSISQLLTTFGPGAMMDLPTRAVADLFPAYDDEDGGVLLVLTPTNNHH